MEHSSEVVVALVFQLAAILIAAKLGGELCERFIKVPPVLGELAAGILIGPYMLGGMEIVGFGPLFPEIIGGHHGGGGFQLPFSESLWSLSQIGAIVLMFCAGLETDSRQFIRHAGPAALVAIGGAAIPFLLGAWATVLFGYADSIGSPSALFVGAIFTATSIGISVRVLADMSRLDTPEGITILGAAVLDDVLGILLLGVVLAVALGGDVSFTSTSLAAAKTLGFWIVLTGVVFLLRKPISSSLDRFRVSGAPLAIVLGLAFFVSALSESFGLAMIIGAFSIGLGLSGTELAERLEEPLRALYHALVPIFFAVIGMMFDVTSIGHVWLFGLVATLLAIVGKVFGSGIPAFFAGFNRVGAWRVGVGMLPRGEVALIMAGIGMGAGVIDNDVFAVAIIVTIVTTILAPVILARSFKEGVSGHKSIE
ncbi:MAG: cation:proton antiporter [Chloroflexota bacterium]|nr:cation:proton antiporter [Chloroflexota bacterium]